MLVEPPCVGSDRHPVIGSVSCIEADPRGVIVQAGVMRIESPGIRGDLDLVIGHC